MLSANGSLAPSVNDPISASPSHTRASAVQKNDHHSSNFTKKNIFAGFNNERSHNQLA